MKASPKLRECESWLVGQKEALQAAMSGEPLEASLGALIRTAVTQFGDETRAAFYLANAAITELHHVVGMPDTYARCVDGFKINPESLACGLAVSSGQPVLTADVEKEPRWREWLWLSNEFRFRSCWSLPVASSAGRAVGTFALYFRDPREASADDLDFVALLTDTASIIVSRHFEAEQRKRAQDSFRRQSERQRLLWEAASVLLTAADPDVMLRDLFAKIQPHLGVDCYFNYLVSEKGNGLEIASYVGISNETAHSIRNLEFGQAICGTAALERRAIHATHIQQSDDPIAQLVKSLGIRAYSCNPLMSGNRLLGTLSFASRERDEFDQEELAFLETISHYATVAYERLQLLRQLREGDRRKDEFLATLAHELRNPLAPIRSSLEILKRVGGSGGLMNQCLATMDRQLSQMVRLVDDLMDMSRITRDKLELRTEELDLSLVVNTAIEACRPMIDAMRHKLSVTLPSEPLVVKADPVRLSQMILNLLNNASKYTEPGGNIELTVQCLDNEVLVSVKDTGIGIEQDMLARIFEMFTQADQSTAKSQGGLGIGLTIVKRLVELHGGTIEAKSEGIKKGSEFIIHLPYARKVVAPADSMQPKTINGAVAKHRVLVVDDNRDAANSLAMLLQLTGHEVHTANDGEEAVTTASTLRPSLILMDIGMPKLDGYGACRRIRNQPWGKDTIMIALTGWGQEQDRQRSSQVGFDHHLVKPVDFPTLQCLFGTLDLGTTLSAIADSSTKPAQR